MSGKIKIIILIVLSLVLTISLFFLIYRKTNEPLINNPQNAVYKIENQNIALSNGKSEIEIAPGSALKIKISIFGEPVFGDLNNDGVKDAALILVQETGGSGTFYYVSAAINNNGHYEGLNSIFLGDRIAPQNVSINNGVIIANYADRKANEPMSALPSVGISKYLKVENSILKEITVNNYENTIQ